jgi:hypothetical protein
MTQLDLLTYQPTPEEMQPPLAPVQSAPKPSSGAIAWQYAKLNYFTKLMSKVIDRSIRDRQLAQATGDMAQYERLQLCRQWHLTKLARLRQQCADRINALEVQT